MADPLPEASRLGVLDGGAFVFGCASCGGVAATLAVSGDDLEIDGGPMPDGSRLTWRPGGPHYVLTFLGVNSGLLSPALTALLVGAERADPLAIRIADRDLAGFCCFRCEANYCKDCWSTWIEFDGPFYDCTRGRCPRDHVQMLDD